MLKLLPILGGSCDFLMPSPRNNQVCSVMVPMLIVWSCREPGRDEEGQLILPLIATGMEQFSEAETTIRESRRISQCPLVQFEGSCSLIPLSLSSALTVLRDQSRSNVAFLCVFFIELFFSYKGFIYSTVDLMAFYFRNSTQLQLFCSTKAT